FLVRSRLVFPFSSSNVLRNILPELLSRIAPAHLPGLFLCTPKLSLLLERSPAPVLGNYFLQPVFADRHHLCPGRPVSLPEPAYPVGRKIVVIKQVQRQP